MSMTDLERAFEIGERDKRIAELERALEEKVIEDMERDNRISATLAIVKEMKRDAKYAPSPVLGRYARRLREALGDE